MRSHIVETIKKQIERTPKELSLALSASISELDSVLQQHAADYNRCGTTATLALMTSDKIHLANVGDSPAVLVRTNGTRVLTKSHRIDLEPERQRIRAAGGRIVWNPVPRVNGILSICRSIGFFALRDFGVTAKPSIYEHSIDPNLDVCLLIATDGATDTLSLPQVSHLVANSDMPVDVSSNVIDFAHDNGSVDNISAIVVALPAWSEHRAHSHTFPSAYLLKPCT
jgi:protein phosphatase 1L